MTRENEDWITTAEAASIGGYHTEYVRKLARDGKVVAKKWIRDWMISRESFVEYISRVEQKGERRGPKKGK